MTRAPVAVIACGALARPLADAAEALGLQLDIHPLPPLLHNRPERIPARVERLAARLRPDYERIAVAYADCGTYGGLDEVCSRLGLARLPGAHCYDVLAGPDEIEQLLAAEPGTYLLTDELVRGFDRLVVQELGLDRHPELRDDYFRHYTRVVWLSRRPAPALRRRAERAATVLGLPLEERPVPLSALEQALLGLVQQQEASA